MPELIEVGVNHVVANTTITTTTEEPALTSEVLLVPTSQARAYVLGNMQITTGAGTTALTPRIRRGATIADTLVGEATALEIAAVAGSDEEVTIHVLDALDDVDQVQYVLTAQQTGASGNGTILQAAILVLLI